MTDDCQNETDGSEGQPVNLDTHQHPQGETWAEYDAQGIYLCLVCAECVDEKLAQFRPEILTGYDQTDVDEPIEPDWV